MKRTGFACKTYTPPPAAPLRALERPVNYAKVSANDPAPAIQKDNPLVSEAYRALVRAMSCAHCGRPPRSQFCHGDQGKGMGLKTDDRTGWPGCGPGPWGPGCHYIVGSTGQYSKEERRALEKELGARTRAAVLASGMWPPRLPLWKE